MEFRISIDVPWCWPLSFSLSVYYWNYQYNERLYFGIGFWRIAYFEVVRTREMMMQQVKPLTRGQLFGRIYQ